MSWITAAIYDRFCRNMEEAGVAEWRAQLLSSLEGSVLEVGAGTGLNLPHYPPSVTRLVVSEPDPHMRRKLEDKHRHRKNGRIEVVDASLNRLPMEEGSFDAVVCTLVLCSVRDPAHALREIRRMLKPGGRLAFLEHVAAERHTHPGRRRWQERIEPLWKRMADNCHLTRETEGAIRDAGFHVEWVERESMRKAMPIVRPSIRGVARAPA